MKLALLFESDDFDSDDFDSDDFDSDDFDQSFTPIYLL